MHIHMIEDALMRAATRILVGALLLWTFMAAAQGMMDLPASIAAANTPIEQVTSGYSLCEGPVIDTDGNLYFSEPPQGNVWKVSADGAVSQWRSGIDMPNGMALDIDGSVVCCENGRVTRLASGGNIAAVLAEGDYGMFNDISIGTGSAMFLTNTGNNVYFRSASGEVTGYCCFEQSNGIEWVPEHNILYVNDYDGDRVMRYAVDIRGVVDIQSGVMFADVYGPDGITVDENYNVYVCSFNDRQIQVYDSSGAELGIIRAGTGSYIGVTNCVFGGPENRTLYITCYGAVYKTELLVAGRVQASPVAARTILSLSAPFCLMRKSEDCAEKVYAISGRMLYPYRSPAHARMIVRANSSAFLPPFPR